jgi:spore maturation protein CgeB
VKKELLAFIVLAREKTYASGKRPKISKKKTYSFKKGSFAYQDTYYDREKVFQGQEVIFYNSRVVWSFSYRGIVNDDIRASEVFSFLKKCLLQQVSNARFYSTCEMEFEKWKYVCKGRGNLEEFSGEETVYFENAQVYLMRYFAGILK